jgi:hypothetical protein
VVAVVDGMLVGQIQLAVLVVVALEEVLIQQVQQTQVVAVVQERNLQIEMVNLVVQVLSLLDTQTLTMQPHQQQVHPLSQ